MAKQLVQILINSLLLVGVSYGQDYLQLQIGNQWIYKGQGNVPLDPLVISVTGTQIIDGKEYFIVLNSPGQQMLVRKNDAGTLVMYSADEKREKNWVAFGAATGEAWRTEV